MYVHGVDSGVHIGVVRVKCSGEYVEKFRCNAQKYSSRIPENTVRRTKYEGMRNGVQGAVQWEGYARWCEGAQNCNEMYLVV